MKDYREEARRYDANAKKILSNREVLGWVLSLCASEYAGVHPLEIARDYILNDQVAEEEAVGDDAELPDRVRGRQNDEADMELGDSRYDLVFDALLPGGGEEHAAIIVEVEPENWSLGKGRLPERGIYYASRLIASQRDTVFKHDDFAKIRKVYSIWVCFNAQEYRAGTCTKYELGEEFIEGAAGTERRKYDKLCVVLVCLPRRLSGSKGALRMLRLLFYDDKPVEDRIKELEDDFGIGPQVLEGTVDEMTFGEAMVLEIWNDGKAEGKAEGIAEGKAEGWVSSALALCDSMRLSLADALELLRVPSERRAECAELAERMQAMPAADA